MEHIERNFCCRTESCAFLGARKVSSFMYGVETNTGVLNGCVRFYQLPGISNRRTVTWGTQNRVNGGFGLWPDFRTTRQLGGKTKQEGRANDGVWRRARLARQAQLTKLRPCDRNKPATAEGGSELRNRGRSSDNLLAAAIASGRQRWCL